MKSHNNVLNKFIKLCGLTWLASIVFFILTLIFNYLVLANNLKIPLSEHFVTTVFEIEIITGLISFGLMTFSTIFLLFLKYEIIIISKWSLLTFFIAFLKFILILTILPLFLIIRLINPKSILLRLFKRNIKTISKKSVQKRIFGIIIICITILPIWTAVYAVIGYISLNQLGYIREPIPIVGTGSMYPTWSKGTKGKTPKELAKEIISTAGFLPYPNGIVINGRRYFGHTLGRGDIITWENDSTRNLTSQNGSDPAGLLKRLIGLPGDTIELRDGVLYLNGEPQKEPYIAKPHSTFGEKFFRECQVITVPNDAVFAMGDNRKGSADSREIGFAPIKDIHRVLPLDKQKGSLDKNWHDPSSDLEDTTKISLDKTKFLELLNQKRKEYGVGALSHEPKLDISATKRGDIILKYDDFSYEATRSGYTMTRAANDSGYYNITYGEWAVPGYYDAEELIDNLFAFPKGKEFLSNKDYDDFGVSEVQGQLNNCPMHLVVLHFAGYVPPNYTKELIESWKTPLTQLKNIQPGWQGLKMNQQFYNAHKAEVDRINDIISVRINNISSIVIKMESNQWLTNEQNNYTNTLDKTLSEEQESLATKLNSY